MPLQFKLKLTLASLIPEDRMTLFNYTRDGNYPPVRIAAFDALLLLNPLQDVMPLVRYLFAVMRDDSSRLVQRRLAQSVLESLPILVAMQDLAPPDPNAGDGAAGGDAKKERDELANVLKSLRKKPGRSMNYRTSLLQTLTHPDVDPEVRLCCLKICEATVRPEAEPMPKMRFRLPPTPAAQPSIPSEPAPVPTPGALPKLKLGGPTTPRFAAATDHQHEYAQAEPAAYDPYAGTYEPAPPVVHPPPVVQPPAAPKPKKDKKDRPPKLPKVMPAQAGGMSGPEVTACRAVLKKLHKAPSAFMFKKPVDPVKTGAVDYYDRIANPMDLSTLGAKLAAGSYADRYAFRDDFKLIVANAKQYNGAESPIGALADDLDALFESQWVRIEATLARFQPGAAPPTHHHQPVNPQQQHQRPPPPPPPAPAPAPAPVPAPAAPPPKIKLFTRQVPAPPPPLDPAYASPAPTAQPRPAPKAATSTPGISLKLKAPAPPPPPPPFQPNPASLPALPPMPPLPPLSAASATIPAAAAPSPSPAGPAQRAPSAAPPARPTPVASAAPTPSPAATPALSQVSQPASASPAPQPAAAPAPTPAPAKAKGFKIKLGGASVSDAAAAKPPQATSFSPEVSYSPAASSHGGGDLDAAAVGGGTKASKPKRKESIKAQQKMKAPINYAEPPDFESDEERDTVAVQQSAAPVAYGVPQRPEVLNTPKPPYPTKWVNPDDPVDLTKARQVLAKVRSLREAFFFQYPVEAVGPLATYYDEIAHPMDLDTLGRRLEQGAYANYAQLFADFDLIVANCERFNTPNTEPIWHVHILDRAWRTEWEKANKLSYNTKRSLGGMLKRLMNTSPCVVTLALLRADLDADFASNGQCRTAGVAAPFMVPVSRPPRAISDPCSLPLVPALADQGPRRPSAQLLRLHPA